MKTMQRLVSLLIVTILYFSNDPLSAQCHDFFGLSPNGGEYRIGAIYKTNENGNISNVSNLFRIEGYFPSGQLLRTSNGKLYGATLIGGKDGRGLIFEWDPVSGEYVVKVHFDGIEKGGGPLGSLIQATNGKLFGMTVSGGIYSLGVLFEWDPSTDIFSKKIDFNGTQNGGKPEGSLVLGINGLIYGVTSTGGENNCGVLFEFNPVNNSYVIKHHFTATENWPGANGSLVGANNGNLYWMISTGGLYDLGVLFELDPSENCFNKEFDFGEGENGSNPRGSLVQAENGMLYGITREGGAFNFGVLFEWDPSGSAYSVKLDFDGKGNGSYPSGDLIRLENGKLLGLTYSGGIHDNGVLFEWDPATNSYIKKHDFDDTNIRIYHGPFILANNGNLYGMTWEGGIPSIVDNYRFGAIIELNLTTLTYSERLKFLDAVDGSIPSNLVEANNGKLYGITHYGGRSNLGVIFEFDPETNTYTKKVDFIGENGVYPLTLIKGNNGKLYGITSGGPDFNDLWTSFEWDPSTGLFTEHFSFDGYTGTKDGRYPNGLLIQAENQKIYGTTFMGGIDNEGVLFEWDPETRTYTKKFDFVGEDHGSNPVLLGKAKSGKLYGSISSRDQKNRTLFEWDPLTDSFIKKLDFNDSVSISTIIQAYNDKFYGVTKLTNRGILYEWDSESNAYTIKLEFNDIESGSTPYGSLTLGENGKLYGMISIGEDENHYAYFEWDPLTEIYDKKFDNFWTNVGEFPKNLVKINRLITGTLNATACVNYISPSRKYTWNVSGEYMDTIPSFSGCDSVIIIYLTIVPVDTSVTLDQGFLRANASEATYQWINCDNDNAAIEGETGKTFSPVTTGHYAVIVAQNGCKDTSSCYSVTLTGFLANTFKQKITLYPNPNNGSFSIDLGRTYLKTEITITEPDGRVLQKNSKYNSRLIDLQMDATPGLYLIIIASENESAVFRIVKL